MEQYTVLLGKQTEGFLCSWKEGPTSYLSGIGINKLIAAPRSPGHAHLVLARGTTLHVRAHKSIPLLQNQCRHVLLTQTFTYPLSITVTCPGQPGLSRNATPPARTPPSRLTGITRCYTDPSWQHTIRGRRANQNACFLIDRDPPKLSRCRVLGCYYYWEVYACMHVPHVFPTQTFLNRRAPRYALDLVASRRTTHFTSIVGHRTCLFEIVQPTHALVTWYPALLLHLVVPHDDTGSTISGLGAHYMHVSLMEGDRAEKGLRVSGSGISNLILEAEFG
jgi:hypothetical protein